MEPQEVWSDPHVVVVDKPFGVASEAVCAWLQERHAYVGLHHRLDQSASGLLLLSVSRAANKGLARQFQGHAVSRVYRVWVLGDPGEEGRWEEPLDGRTARSDWRRLAAGRISALEIRLHTGRTHQIRRHAAGAGHPVIGDRRHGGAAGRLWPRLALHAAELALEHPVKRRPLRFEAPLPADLEGLPR